MSKHRKPPSAELLAPRLLGEEEPIRLRVETYEKAREIAPRLDIYYLEGEWRDWMTQKGEKPKNPDQAFLGFLRKKATQHNGF